MGGSTNGHGGVMVMPNGLPHIHQAGGVLKIFMFLCLVNAWDNMVGFCLSEIAPSVLLWVLVLLRVDP